MLPRVGHSGIEPETSDLSGLRANRLCQCPEASPVPTYIRNGPQGDRLHHTCILIHVVCYSSDIIDP